jgi:hypothetical protein
MNISAVNSLWYGKVGFETWSGTLKDSHIQMQIRGKNMYVYSCSYYFVYCVSKFLLFAFKYIHYSVYIVYNPCNSMQL